MGELRIRADLAGAEVPTFAGTTREILRPNKKAPAGAGAHRHDAISKAFSAG